MKRVLSILIIILFLFSACSKSKGSFEIINNSDHDLEYVSIQPDSNGQLLNIPKGTKGIVTTNMDDVKSDGSYLLSYKNANTGELVEHKFGYYTNGYQIEEKITITIKNNTLDVTVDNDIIIINKEIN